jgi:hypothetical protein
VYSLAVRSSAGAHDLVSRTSREAISAKPSTWGTWGPRITSCLRVAGSRGRPGGFAKDALISALALLDEWRWRPLDGGRRCM